MIRLLVVDDSALMRHLLRRLLGREPDLVVAGTARNGEEALAAAARLRPDVITLDVEMPGKDGLATLYELMRDGPYRVVMLSTLTRPQATATVRALALGAVEAVAKPTDGDLDRLARELSAKIRLAARVPLDALRRAGSLRPDPPRAPRRVPPAKRAAALPAQTEGSLSHVVAIAASTGGPRTLLAFGRNLPPELPCGYLIVQHMPAGFTRSLAEHLDAVWPVPVREAVQGERLRDGLCLVAPAGYHLRLGPEGEIDLGSDLPQHGVRPAADPAFESVARHFGPRAVGIVLTGMGFDGARGAVRLREAGGYLFAQDEESSVVFGMPRAAIELAGVDAVLPPEAIAGRLPALFVRPQKGRVCR